MGNNKKNKTKKKFKMIGGADDGKQLKDALNGAVDKALNFHYPSAVIKDGIIKTKNAIFDLNRILTLSGMLLKNFIFFSMKTNLEYLLPEGVCYDLFHPDMCKAKIETIIGKNNKTREYEYINHRFYKRENQRGGTKKRKKSKKTKTFKGGTGNIYDESKECKKCKRDIYCPDDRIKPQFIIMEELNKKKVDTKSKKKVESNIDVNLTEYSKTAVEPNAYSNKKSIFAKLFNSFSFIKIQERFILLSILSYIFLQYNTEIKEKIKLKLSDQAKLIEKKDGIGVKQIINITNPFQSMHNNETIEKCQNFHLGTLNYSDHDEFKKISKECKLDCRCEDCTVFEQSKLINKIPIRYNENIRYSFKMLLLFLKNYFYIDLVLKDSLLYKNRHQHINNYHDKTYNSIFTTNNEEELYHYLGINTIEPIKDLIEPDKTKLLDICADTTLINYKETLLHSIVNSLRIHNSS